MPHSLRITSTYAQVVPAIKQHQNSGSGFNNKTKVLSHHFFKDITFSTSTSAAVVVQKATILTKVLRALVLGLLRIGHTCLLLIIINCKE